MDSLIINGGKKLIGNIPISGSKNACLPMMIASLMTDEKMTLVNVPMLSDVKTLISILKSLGANIEHKKDHKNVAWEKFLPGGPLAILPLKDQNQSSIVWIAKDEIATAILQLNNKEFVGKLQ